MLSNELKIGFGGSILFHSLLISLLYMQIRRLPKVETVIAPSSLEVHLVSRMQKKVVVKKNITEQKDIKETEEQPPVVKKILKSEYNKLKRFTPAEKHISSIKELAIDKTLIKQDIPEITIKTSTEELMEESNTKVGAYVEAQQKQFHNKPPAYPQFARERGYEGVSTARIWITAKGLVEDVQVIKTSGFKILDRAVIKAVKKWKFQPAARFGINVKSILDIQFVFKLKETKGEE